MSVTPLYLLPHHPTLITENRGLVSLSKDEELSETVPLWSIVSAALSAPRTWTIQALVELIELFLLHTDAAKTVNDPPPSRRRLDKTPRAPDVDISFLRQFLYEGLTNEERLEFLGVTLPWLASLCLRLPELFPEHHLPCLASGKSLTLTPIQVGCVLGHMFFCTMRTPSWSDYWASMAVWHGRNWIEHPPRSSVQVYYRSLLVHWRSLRLGEQLDRSLKYERRCLIDPNITAAHAWATCAAPLLSLHSTGGVADVEMDFANKDVTFGPGATQEERLLGLSPELLLLAVIAPTMSDNDALVISGARIAGECTMQQRELYWAGPHVPTSPRDWNNRRVCCVDALEIDAMTERWTIEELRPSSMLRELNKLYTAWEGCKGARIATGHWGCGTFGGNRHAKSLIQVMAASRAGAQLIFTSVEDFASGSGTTFGAQLGALVSALQAKQLTVGGLFNALVALGEEIPPKTPAPDLWQLLMAKLEIQCTLPRP